MLISYIEKKGRNKVKVTLADGESFMISEKDWNSFGEEAGRDIADGVSLKKYIGNICCQRPNYGC